MKAHKGELLAILLRGAPEESADDLLEEMAECGYLLRLDDAGRLVKDGLPADLADRVAQHEGDLTQILAHEAQKLAAARRTWQAALDELEGDPLFPRLDVLRSADARWVDDPEAGERDESTEVIDPPDPCLKCGTLELWQSLAGNWRCLRCDPPIKAQRLAEARSANKHEARSK